MEHWPGVAGSVVPCGVCLVDTLAVPRLGVRVLVALGLGCWTGTPCGLADGVLGAIEASTSVHGTWTCR